MELSDTSKVLKEKDHLKNRLLLEGLMVGVIAGVAAVVYRLMLSNAESFLFNAIAFIKDKSMYILWFVFLMVLAFIVSKCLKFEPYISGSGIPQVEAEVEGKIDECWYKVLFTKMIAGTLCIIGGLSLGREGPSIQLGAMAGKGVSKLFHRLKSEENFLITCGAAAGLSAAFNAPLAGIMFALEEVHKNFSKGALISVMSASLIADFISRIIFGMSPSLHYVTNDIMPLNYYYWVVIIGVVAGLCGILYNKGTVSILKVYDKIPLKKHHKVYIAFVLAGVLAFIMPEMLAGGHTMVDYLNGDNIILSTLFVYLIIKFVFSALCFGSGAPGGIFFPMLILGSLIGAILGKVAMMCGVESTLFFNFIILAMAAFFASIVRAPLTGIILITEMCGTMKILLPIALVSFVSYTVANSLKCEPIYESLLERLVGKNNSDYFIDNKILVTYVVEMGSVCVGQKVKDIYLPRPCLFVSVVRGNKELIPRGETEFHPGDEVIMLVDKKYYALAKKEIGQLFETQ